jgi:hypothetical protein
MLINCGCDRDLVAFKKFYMSVQMSHFDLLSQISSQGTFVVSHVKVNCIFIFFCILGSKIYSCDCCLI